MRRPVLSRYLQPELLNQLAAVQFRPRLLVEGNLAGAHKSPLDGFAVEFVGHREYVLGDDPRHIDWRVYYTRDKYFVKQYEMETNLVCHLVLDVSASMRYGIGRQQKLLYGAQFAAALAYCVLRQHDKVSLATIDDRVRGYLRPSNSFGQILRMTEHLDHTRPVETTRLCDSLLDLAGRFGRHGIVVILSDFMDDVSALEAAIQHLRFHANEVVLLQVLHPDELEFNFDGQTRFEGLETRESIVADPHDVRQRYLEELHAFCEELQQMAARNRSEYVLINSGDTLAHSLKDYLQKRYVRKVHRSTAGARHK
jgi:uncharacterized protein (DUF58 family)